MEKPHFHFSTLARPPPENPPRSPSKIRVFESPRVLNQQREYGHGERVPGSRHTGDPFWRKVTREENTPTFLPL